VRGSGPRRNSGRSSVEERPEAGPDAGAGLGQALLRLGDPGLFEDGRQETVVVGEGGGRRVALALLGETGVAVGRVQRARRELPFGLNEAACPQRGARGVAPLKDARIDGVLEVIAQPRGRRRAVDADLARATAAGRLAARASAGAAAAAAATRDGGHSTQQRQQHHRAPHTENTSHLPIVSPIANQRCTRVYARDPSKRVT